MNMNTMHQYFDHLISLDSEKLLNFQFKMVFSSPPNELETYLKNHAASRSTADQSETNLKAH